MNKYQKLTLDLMQKHFDHDPSKPFLPSQLAKVKTYDSLMQYVIKYWSRQVKIVSKTDGFSSSRIKDLEKRLYDLHDEVKKLKQQIKGR